MQENDQSRRAGRPSLLSEQAPSSDSGSILSKLDGGAGASRSGGAGGGAGRVAGIAAAVALTGGAIGWGISSMEAPAPVLPPVAAVAPSPQAAAAPVLPPSAAQVVTVPAVAPAAGSDVSAATILEEVPAKTEPGARSLVAALEGPPPKRAAGTKNELAALLDKAPVADTAQKTPAGHPAKPKHDAVKLAKADKAEPKHKTEKSKADKDKAAKDKLAKEKSAKDKARTAAAERSKPAARKEKAPDDGDVALLAALLAHSKKAPARAKPMTEYQKCSTLDSVAAADKCRERLCASGPKAPAECKPPRVAKASN